MALKDLKTEGVPQEECFIVSVIGKKDSEQRKHADWFLSGVVEPVFRQHFPNVSVIRADGMKTPGMITSQIVEKLLNCRLVIADMTFLNPNVFYEIGIRHMTNKPIIHAHHEGEGIPFDVAPYLSMEYSLDEHHHMLAAQTALRDLVERALSPDFKVDNPVTQARGRAKFEETANPTERVLLSTIDGLGERLSALERQQANTIKSRAGSIADGPTPPSFVNLSGGQLIVSTTDRTLEGLLKVFIEDFVEPNEMLGLRIKHEGEGAISLLLGYNFPREVRLQMERGAANLGLDCNFI